jgi:hypothetical protein
MRTRQCRASDLIRRALLADKLPLKMLVTYFRFGIDSGVYIPAAMKMWDIMIPKGKSKLISKKTSTFHFTKIEKK